MATGIVSIAANLTGPSVLSYLLTALNIALAAVLLGLYLARALVFPRAVLEDIRSHRGAVGFLTLVAGISVLGEQFVLVLNLPGYGFAVLILASLLWCVFLYGLLGVLIASDRRVDLAESIHGGWLLIVVATQGLVVLGATVHREFGGLGKQAVFGLLCLWLVGGMQYVWLITILFLRQSFFGEDRFPQAPYWINMGAAAISTVAGSLLLLNCGSVPIFVKMRSFIMGMTVLFWATATWWVPLLVIMGVWHHVIKREPLVYNTTNWSFVFPLGMYTVSCYYLDEVVPGASLRSIAQCMFYPALAAWVLTAVGASRSAVRVMSEMRNP